MIGTEEWKEKLKRANKMKEFGEINMYYNRYMNKRSKRRNDSLAGNRTTNESRASLRAAFPESTNSNERPRVVFTNIDSQIF